MERFFNILRKTLVGTTVLIFTFVVIYTPQQHNSVPKAEAGWPTFETNPVLIGGAVASTNQAIKEIALDQIGFLLAKTMISQMLQSMITWINSGFKGSPAFIQDLDRFLLNVADETAGEFIRGLGDIGSFICSPFRLDIQLALSLKYQQAREGRDEENICTLSGVVNNVEDFFNSQISDGSFWQQWIRVTSRPQAYTPYGQFMAADARLNAEIANARGQRIQLANWGDGFLSNEICELVEGSNGSNKRCVISTPGKVISEQINKALGAGQDQLVAADEINEVISALLGQIANQALSGAAGLLGLSRGTGFTAGGFGEGSYVDELARESQNESDSVLAQSYEGAREKLKVQQDYLALSNEYIPKLQAVITAATTSARFRGLSVIEISNLKDRAQVSYNDAIDVRANAATHIAFLAPLVKSLEDFQRELATPGITPERKQVIASEQTRIINRTASYSAYTLLRLRTSEREWSRITGS
jgi:hypothetical protein